MILTQFQTVGRDLFNQGLVSSNTGNLSIRLGERIIITRRGSRLGSLEENDLIETGLCRNDRATPLASEELFVHRAIYTQTSAQAVVHAHPPHGVALSLTEALIEPGDDEGLSTVGQVPVLIWHRDIPHDLWADTMVRALKEHRLVMVRGHGTFAIGQLLEEAHNYTTIFEESCRVLYLLRSLHPTKRHRD
jgi:L-fuculose-phosphate aldolase